MGSSSRLLDIYTLRFHRVETHQPESSFRSPETKLPAVSPTETASTAKWLGNTSVIATSICLLALCEGLWRQAIVIWMPSSQSHDLQSYCIFYLSCRPTNVRAAQPALCFPWGENMSALQIVQVSFELLPQSCTKVRIEPLSVSYSESRSGTSRVSVCGTDTWHLSSAAFERDMYR